MDLIVASVRFIEAVVVPLMLLITAWLTWRTKQIAMSTHVNTNSALAQMREEIRAAAMARGKLEGRRELLDEQHARHE